jgi:predicted transcriptional regulator
MAKSLVEMAAEIVAAQAGHTRLTQDEISESLKRTFDTLRLIQAEAGGEALPELKPQAPAITPAASIQRNKVICLECGAVFKQLTKRHLIQHNITPKEYRKKYGMPSTMPLAAKSLVAKRRQMAKDLGLGEKLAAARKKRQKK